jgi:hypothetical protein
MAKRDIVMNFKAGEPRTGGWCERCALPSLIEVDIDIVAETPNGVPLGVDTAKAAYCTNHDGPGGEAP